MFPKIEKAFAKFRSFITEQNIVFCNEDLNITEGVFLQVGLIKP